MAKLSSMSLILVLTLLISSASGQVTQCASDGTPQLRFVAQLRVSGCTLFVHDTGANDGPHLAVEPLMCVTYSLNKIYPRYDPITQQMYVSIPVMLRNDAMLTEVQHQLRHLSPKSVKFATVSKIRVSTNSLSNIQAIGFVWSSEESVGFLRLRCKSNNDTCGACETILQAVKYDIQKLVQLSATIVAKNSNLQLNYHLMKQNNSYLDPNVYTGRFKCLPVCQQLRFIRSIRLINCTARVHQRLDMKGHFFIEPLLCHNITNMSNESIMYDYNRDMYYLNLDVVLQDDITLDAVRTQLGDLSPRSVTFMRLWRAQSVVASALSRRFVIGPLMVSADLRSAQVRAYCRTDDECKILRSAMQAEPVDLWQHVPWSVTSLMSNRCLVMSEAARYSWIMQEGGGTQTSANCSNLVKTDESTKYPKKFNAVTADGRKFVKIQQRQTGSVSFEQNWTEYERGFGDDTDFWIGLSTIHSLSINGATLRVEMKLWNGTELHAEFKGFKVGNASTKYLMTYTEMLRNRSNVTWDAMEHNKGMMFSTFDRDNDGHRSVSCSKRYGGKSGWWFNTCSYFNPNGIYGGGISHADATWYNDKSGYLPFREVRLMLQI